MTDTISRAETIKRVREHFRRIGQRMDEQFPGEGWSKRYENLAYEAEFAIYGVPLLAMDVAA